MRFLDRYRDPIHAATRIVVGFLFLCHGVQKWLAIFGGTPPPMPAPLLYSAAFLEAFGGTAFALGLFTRPVAFVLSGMMAVAYFMAHQKDGLLPIQNHGELAALYCWIFLLFSVLGPGPWSLDAAQGRS
jgi:putative oxidoreductase